MLQQAVNILLVDDDHSLRNMLSFVLGKEGYQVDEAVSGMDALKKLKTRKYDLVISDIRMPGLNGIDLLKKIKTHDQELPVIMITAYAATHDAIEAMKLGAEDYIMKPFNLEELKIIINKSLHKKSIEKENIELKQKLSDKENFENIVGSDPKMGKIFELISTVAQTDSTVLISGESGTGKELIARAIHAKSSRANQKFVSINCGALPENLLESELFGHKKGAFTDAYQDKEGLFEAASLGTLFLDEISEMSQKMQVKVLRGIQEKVIRRVGGNKEIAVDVRIITATNRDLAESIEKGEFRSDLYYRLNVISIKVPPLRERKEDIPILMQHFLQRYNQKFAKNIQGFDKRVFECFANYRWPGNVRELENFIERGVALEKDEVIRASSLPAEVIYNMDPSQSSGADWPILLDAGDFDFNQYIDNLSKSIIIKALEMSNGNVKKTALRLKVNYRSLRYLIEKYNLKLRS
ncbi:MAG: sigma-54 dependent transcriptional regulator [Acidobacteria bacterium]|nr:sigma-54 dependent transcriptional regulator [Acidobacteriota bacterium]MBU4307870.1 sigma-54 dependent transcriptional regulator [Acidobacteriota bacterium]MBU4405196.1 sigma-54 dependent transcriptional regulator [Acidobacteriota bacterium]MCG2811008.1 sigma-54 dependent transcriptional regulator [Candidatus Aminicenantes bacterium]